MIKGKKRHVLVDTQGLLLHGIITAADVQDRDGGRALLATLFGLFLFLRKLFADSAYQPKSGGWPVDLAVGLGLSSRFAGGIRRAKRQVAA